MTSRVRRVTVAGWEVHLHPSLASTNDEAARLRDAGAGPRVAVLADHQTAGRGRAGHTFASPPGGFYVSLLLSVRKEDLPGFVTGAVALAVAEGIEATAGVPCGIKWPNDLMVGGRKVGGLLLEAVGATRPVVAGIGLNLESVPAELPHPVAVASASLAEAAGTPPSRDVLLAAVLVAMDRRQADLQGEAGRAGIAAAWRRRLVLVGARIRYEYGGAIRGGRLLDADLTEGILVEDDLEGQVWRRAEHVREIRALPAG